MMYLEEGYETLGYGYVTLCTHCNNTSRQILKRRFSNVSFFVPIDMIKKRGELLSTCYTCNWGCELDLADVSSIKSMFDNGKNHTKKWLKECPKHQKKRLLVEYSKLGLHDFVAFINN
jgi:hypothetical protein